MGDYNSHFDHNSFSNLSAEGIYGFPGNNDTYDNNKFDYVWEPIHLVAATNTTDISNNVITHAKRIGIELQDGMTNLTVANNWISDFVPNLDSNGVDSHMGISCATGGYQNSSGQWVAFGEHINITGNTILQNGPDQGLDMWAKSAIEIMGDSDINITNNYMWGWGTGVLNGTSVGAGNVSNNVMIGTSGVAADAASWPISGVHGSGNSDYSMGASNAPAWPAAPSGVNVGSASTGGTTTTAPASTVAAPTNFAATSPSSSEVDLSWADNTSGTGTYVLQRRATNGSAGFTTIATLAAGATSYADTSVTATWQYDYQLVAVVSGDSSNTASVQVQVQAAPVVTPPVVSTPVVTPPVVSTPVVAAVVSAATNFAAVASSSSEVDLSWTDSTSGTGTYILERRATNGSGGFQTIATLASGATSYKDTSVTARWQYDYQLTAVLNGVSSSVVTVHAQVPDVAVSTPAPVVTPVATAAPTSLSAASPNSAEVDLSWTDNTSGQGTYILQRRATHGSTGFQTIATLAAGTTSYTDTNVNAQWEYDYQLTAVMNGVTSNVAAVHTQVLAAASVSAPVVSGVTAAPTNFVAISPSGGEVDLSWTDNSNGQAAYVLQRRATRGAGRFQTIATIASGVNSYSDVHVTRNWEYDYRLVAVLSGVASPTVAAHVQVQNSAAGPVAAAAAAPAAPSLLLASSPNSNEVDLNWVDNSDGAATFVLARRASKGTDGYSVIATIAAGTTSFKDTNVTANWQYDYYLVAVSPGAASTPAIVSIQVQPMISVIIADAA